MGCGERFLASTRGQVVVLLRRSERTVNELAAALGLTDNAIRAHLSSLERDGLVERRGVRRGVGKPAHLYGLTDEAERLFPKAYDAVLAGLLGVLTERLGSAEVEALLAEVGRRAASGHDWPEGVGPRLDAALALVGEMGGLAEVVRRDGSVLIEGYSCPLSALVPSHPEVCRVLVSLLSEAVGAPVQGRCDHGAHPRCSFVVDLSACGAAS